MDPGDLDPPYHESSGLPLDEASTIGRGTSYPMWSPDSAFTAAEAMLHALAADQGPS